MAATASGGMLRYPYEAITEKTDYLQLTIFEYDTAANGTGNELIAANLTNQNPFSSLSIAAGVAKNKILGKDGVIALPMPSNIEDSNSVSYEAGNMDQLTEKGLNIAAGAIDGNLFNVQGLGNKLNELTAQIIGGGKGPDGKPVENPLITGETVNLVKKALGASAINVFGANVSLNSLLARSEGRILNPNMELLFNGPTLRTFRFSFKMTPRDENESVSIKSIIRTLKKNMAAKGVGDLFLKTPNIFELQYKKGNRPHPFLNLFKPCALTDISVNYTGENVYATYADGTPISMVMTLTFKELVPIYAEDYDKYKFDNTDYDFKDDDLVYGTNGTAPNKIQNNNIQGVGY